MKIFPTLDIYMEGNIAHLWSRELFTLRDADPQLHPYRAGELAAAAIAARAGQEYAQLEEALKFKADEGTYPAYLYDWLGDHEDVKSVLQDLSGSRTLLEDMEASLHSVLP